MKCRLKGELIKERMLEQGATPQQLVSYSGVSKRTLDRALNGECVYGHTALKLSRALLVPMEELIAEEVRP